MIRRVRTIGVLAVLVVAGMVVILVAASAGPTEDAHPGRAEAEKLLDCAPGEGVFAYQPLWSEGGGFASPEDALKAILTAMGSGLVDAQFIGQDVAIDDEVARQFTIEAADVARTVVWAVPFKDGWIADGVYGCTATAE